MSSLILKNTLPRSSSQMYAEALHENERLKSRLQDSKQELVKIRSQLEKVTQVKRDVSPGCAEQKYLMLSPSVS